MIKPGEYRTKQGLCAEVSQANSYGAIGWVSGLPIAWNASGTAIINRVSDPSAYDLDLPRTIKIPESELPEPEREEPIVGQDVYVFNPGRSNMVLVERWKNTTYCRDLFRRGLYHRTRKAAEQWAAWWRDVIGGER